MSIEPSVHGPQVEDSDATVNQVSAFLLRPEVDSFADALREPTLTPTPLAPSSGLAGVLYLARSESPEPRWLPFLRSLVSADIAFERPRRLSAVLFIERGEQRYALTFGYGRHLLRRDALEPDFGLKVAAGLIDPDEIASVDARSMEATAIQIRRQSSRGVDTRSIGLNIGREMLRAIAGRVEDESIGSRVVGADSIGLTHRLNIAELGPHLDRLYEVYARRAYKDRFGHIDRWARLRPGPEQAQLDERLRNALATRRAQLLAGEDPDARPGPERPPNLEAPEVIEWRASGFRTSPEPDGVLHPFPTLDAYLESVRRDPTDSDLRRNHFQSLVSDEATEVIASWPIYEAINWEVELDGQTYVLAEGSWWAIDADYRKRIDAIVEAIPAAELPRPDFDSDVEHEPDYNKRLAAYAPGRAMLDRTEAHFRDEHGTVEPCDVFTIASQFIHVKRDHSSAMLSHLFGQAAVSARLFLMLPEFRDQIRGLLAATPDLAALVPTGSPTTADYEIVLGIISSAPTPVALGLPFFARNFLAQVVPDIESMGYKVRVAHIEERPGCRPGDAGLLFREEAEQKALVRLRSAKRSRRTKSPKPVEANPS
jgi:uncharacterized protein (TIGR04141 family)